MPWSPRCIPLAEAGYGETPALFMCAECGAVVASSELHDKWHKELARKVRDKGAE